MDDSSPISQPSKESLQPTINNSELSALGIPSSFKILNHTIHVLEIPVLLDMGRYGDYDGNRNEIRLFTEGVCDDVILHTYYHELMHCLFDKAGYPDHSNDETLVDQIGGLLAQYLKDK